MAGKGESPVARKSCPVVRPMGLEADTHEWLDMTSTKLSSGILIPMTVVRIYAS